MTNLQRFCEALTLTLAAALLCLSKPTDKRSIILPPSLQPEQYDLSIVPRLDWGVFQGRAIISGVAVLDTESVVLHCDGLVFNMTSLTDLTADEEVEVVEIQEDKLLQQCHLMLARGLRADHEYRLSMEFMGLIHSDGVGFYKDFYVEEGTRHNILMTHFQPNYARCMFPCFDEPHYKAQFTLRVARPEFLPTVISNMPIISVYTLYNPDSGNQTWVEFEETPPMSSYLVVLVMSDYLALSDSVTNSSVWTSRGRLHEAQLALNVSAAVLAQCESYFDLEYVLPKLDHVAVPTLNNVAMENWGTITYRKDFLLWEEGVSTWAQKEMVTMVICHEIIHQWLGNLVTTTWWNTTWLNEGVTSFYHYYFMTLIEPSWNVMDNTFVVQIHQILAEEATRDPKPLTYNEPLSQEAIVSSAFSATTYIKGAAIMRMVFNLMAPDVFRDAIRQYILDNEYESVDEEDLWQSLGVVADLPHDLDLQSVMYSWTHQPGFPLVTVSRGDGGCLSVRQEKYLAEDEDAARWTIPLTYTTSSELDFNFSTTAWLLDTQTELELGVCLEPDDWVIVNIRQSGFYRVNYDALTWQALTHDLQHCDLTDVHVVNRAQLLNDGFDLARYGLLPYTVVLELSRYLARETEVLPWQVAINWLNTLRQQLFDSDVYPLFQRYALGLLERVFQQMSLTGEAGGMLPELHRKQVVEFACLLEHPRCVKEATDTVYLLMSGVQAKMPLDLAGVILCAAVRHGQEEVWHFVLKQYEMAAENERPKYLTALVCTRNDALLNRMLKDISSFPLVLPEERIALLLELGKHDVSLDIVMDVILELVLNNFKVVGRFGGRSQSSDIEVLLHILRSFITPKLNEDQRNKISRISSLVKTTGIDESIDFMESMMKEIERPDYQYLQEDLIKEWFRKTMPEDEDEDDVAGEEDEEAKDRESSILTHPPRTATQEETTLENTSGHDSPLDENYAEENDSEEVDDGLKSIPTVSSCSLRITLDVMSILLLIFLYVTR